MSDIVIVGGGVGGLVNAMLLAKDGHRVTVLERDPAEPVRDPHEAWEGWERRGVNQFRMLHFLLPRWRELIEAELPEVAGELAAFGALRYNMIGAAVDDASAAPGDERFATLTARRPVIEAAVAAAVAATAGVTVRRGVGVDALLVGDAVHGIPCISGVRTAGGDDVRADLVVDSAGRRSALPRLLADVGARAPYEEVDDCGFVYYGRHYRSTDGSIPAALGPPLQHYGTISSLCLPADNGTWGVGVVASAGDTALRALKDPQRWEAVVGSHPLIAHWLDGEPLADEVAVMAKIEDRYRRYVVDGAPVAVGVASVGDAWACTNPSLGRGITIAMFHALALRETLRHHSLEDSLEFALAFDEATVRDVEPWYRATVQFDRHRLAEVDALLAGRSYEPEDPAWEATKALDVALTQDGELLRGFAELASLLAPADEIFARPGFMDKVVSLGGGWRDAPVLGPSREELLATVTG